MITPTKLNMRELESIQEKSDVTHIGVVTVTFNAEVLLDDFFESLGKQSLRCFTVYVIDNASTDRTVEKIKARYIDYCELTENTTNLGVAEANNQGIDAAFLAGCSHVLFINNDTRFEGDLFERLLASLNGKDRRVVTPKIPFFSTPERLWFAGGHFSPTFVGFCGTNDAHGQLDSGQYDHARLISFAPTCCLLVESSVIREIGPMDPAYFVYFDDTDFCKRMDRAGISIWYEPSAVLLHKVGQSTGGDMSPFTVRYMVRNRVYFVRKHFSGGRRMLFLAYIAGTQLLRGIQYKNLRLRLSSYLDGCRLPTSGDRYGRL